MWWKEIPGPSQLTSVGKDETNMKVMKYPKYMDVQGHLILQSVI